MFNYVVHHFGSHRAFVFDHDVQPFGSHLAFVFNHVVRDSFNGFEFSS